MINFISKFEYFWGKSQNLSAESKKDSAIFAIRFCEKLDSAILRENRRISQ
ncbi:hypothetical protein [Helicobacter sp. 23-1045]